MQKRTQQTKVRTTTNARQSSRGSPGTKPLSQGSFSRTSGCEACSGRPFMSSRGSGTSFYSFLETIGGSSGGLSRARAALRHPRVPLWSTRADPRAVPAATFERWDVKRGSQGAPSGPEQPFWYDSTVFSFQIGSGSCPDRLLFGPIFPLKPVQI